tara:strand:+ start:15377 stop:15550 length:174 start_codon:yes stop_codon:yes gene_type:complete
MRKRRPSTSSPAARNQRHRNLSRYLRKRHLHLKHRQREVQRMINLDEDNHPDDPTPP